MMCLIKSCLFFLELDIQFGDDLLGVLCKVTLHHPVIIPEVEFGEHVLDQFSLVLAEVENELLLLVENDAASKVNIAVVGRVL